MERDVNGICLPRERFKDIPDVHGNTHTNTLMVQEFCPIDGPSRAMLKKAMEHLQLSARAYDRIIKVAQTSADLAGKEQIGFEHLALACHSPFVLRAGRRAPFRSLDR